MKSIKINAWNQEIMFVAQINQEIIVELEDVKFSSFSPLSFEETMQIRQKLSTDEEISKIGVLSDSISGSYGKNYFNKYFMDEKGKIPTLIDRLSFIGKDGLGVLEFEPHDDIGISEDMTFLLKDFKQLSMDVYEGNTSHRLATLVAKSNSGAGGAKAKAVIQYNPSRKTIHLSDINNPKVDGFIKSIMKFNNSKNSIEIKRYNDELKIEFIYYILAKKSGIIMSDSWLEKDNEDNYYFITKRFDVDNDDNRVHMHSLAGVLSHDASSFTLGYESLFRVGMMLGVDEADKLQMFKSMVFNIIFANRDDHSRNFSFLMDGDYNWSYAPSYDLTYTPSNRWHQLTVDKKPTHQLRSLSLVKIAKLCNIKEPLKIMSEMIAVKEKYLMALAKEYDVEELANMIFKDTKEVDNLFRRKV